MIIINILGEFVGGPLFFAFQTREVEFIDCITIEGSSVPFNHGIMAIDSHGGIIVRDGEGENLPMELFLAFYRPEKLNKSSDSDGHAVRVLTIGNIESASSTLHLAGEEGKVHPRCSHEVGLKLGPDFTDKRFKFFELFFSKRRASESHGVVWLWTSTMKRDCTIPTFVNTFVEIIEVWHHMLLICGRKAQSANQYPE